MKAVIIILATLAAMGILYNLVGARLMSTAVNVPPTEHTSTFAISWALVGLVVIGGIFWKAIKG